MALTDDIKAYYKLEDTSDSAGSYTLTQSNGSFGAGKIDNCFIDDTDDYLYVATDFGIAYNASYSICGWVKNTQEIASGTKQFFSWRNANGGSSKFRTRINYEYNSGTRRLYFDRLAGTSWSTTSNITMGTNWVFVAVTYNGSNGTCKAYINGSEVGSSGTSQNTTTGLANSFTLGGENSGETKVNYVNFDEFGVWGRELSSTEISKLYNSGNGLQYPFTTTSIKSINGLAYGSVKSYNGLAKASIKNINGLS